MMMLAKTVEKGVKKKKLKESSGGTLDDLAKIGEEKLDKWEKRLK